MGKHIHRLSNIDINNKTATCLNCGDVSIKISGKDKYGNNLLRCKIAYKHNKDAKIKPWLLHRQSICSKCGFIPEHECQLDVDHINGDKSDNSVSNLQTLCANCHRLKTHLNRDSFNLTYR